MVFVRRPFPPWLFSLGVFGLMLVLSLILSASARSQPAVQVLSVDAVNRFPDGITFQLNAQSEGEITRVLLRYSVAPDGAAAFGEPEFEKGRRVQVTFELQTGARLYLPPGAEITWFWELYDASGQTVTTTPQRITYEDTRFPWRILEDGNLILKYYSGSEGRARELLNIGRSTIDRMSRLEGVQIDFPIKIYVYASERDGQAAMRQRSRRFNELVETGGTRVASDTVLIFDPDPDVLRHELAHVVTRVAGEGPFGDIPAWLNEGLSVYAQQRVGRPYEQALELAVRRDRVLSLRSISSAPGDPSLVNLFYGQSWSVVKYLIDTYGEEKLAQLLATFKRGARTDDAFRQVYGTDVLGIENGWRQSMGLRPRQPGSQEEGGTQVQPVPTLVPFGAEGSQAPPPPPGEQGPGQTAPAGSEVPLMALILIAVLTILLAGGIAGGSWYFWRRYH